MTEIPPNNRNQPSNHKEPSEEVKKNKAKAFEVGGPILSQRIPNLKGAERIYVDHKMPHEVKKATLDTKTQKVTNNFKKMFSR